MLFISLPDILPGPYSCILANFKKGQSMAKILIAGGGIGGLVAAGCLLLDGHDVEIYEQAPELGEIGAGIQ
ncbi:MAG: NAD(P)-binding protein, partial [Rhodospirillaceae bacterium]|nr:NAD(P)-binding protein [Rhodospirillaceae bacterium]